MTGGAYRAWNICTCSLAAEYYTAYSSTQTFPKAVFLFIKNYI